MTVRIAMLGCGAVARRYHLPALKRCAGVEVAAFASRTITSARAAAEDWGSGDVSSDWRSAIERDDVDAVDICSPNAFHREQAVAAAMAGKHVLVEKPMACSDSETGEMIAAADEAGVVLHVAHNLRYLPAIVGMRSAVVRVGQITAVRMAFGHSGPRDWAPDSTWFFDPKLSGGGALLDLGIHAIDLVLHVTGLEVTDVAAMTFGQDPVEDAAHVLMRFDSGAIGAVHASWVARPAPDFALAVFGTEGTLGLTAARPPALRTASGEKQDVELPSEVSSPYEDFVRAVRGEPPAGPATPALGEDGRAAVAIVSAAYESARTNETVSVER